jgi:hypothetical protein
MKATGYCRECRTTKRITELSFTPKQTTITLECGHQYQQKCNRGSLVLK